MLPRSLNREFAFILNDVARMLRTYADHKGGQFGITRAQWAVLARLDRFEGLKQSELAEMLDLQPITLTRLLDRLCECGLIERRADPNDRRAKRLFLTPAARPLLEQLGELGEDTDGDGARGRRRESIEQIVAQLAIVKENLRQAIQQRSRSRRAGRAALWLSARQIVIAERDEAPEVRDGAAQQSQRRAQQIRGQRPARQRRASCGRRGGCVGACLPLCRSFLSSAVLGTSSAARSCRPTTPMWTPRRSASRPTSPASCRTSTSRTTSTSSRPGAVPARSAAVPDRSRQCQGQLAQTALTIDAMKQDYKHMLSDVAAQQAQVDLDQTNYNRDTCCCTAAPSRRPCTIRRNHTLANDKSKLESLQQQAQVQLARLGGNADIPTHAASAISASAGAGRRGATPARSHRRQGAVRRHSSPTCRHRAGQISRRLDDRVLPGRYRSCLDRRPIRKKPN